jgi:hypothetical protein
VLIILTFLLAGCSNNSRQTTSNFGITNIPSTIILQVNDKDVSIPLTDYKIIHNNGNGTATSTNPNDSAKNNKFKTPMYSTYSPNSKVIIVKSINKQPKINVSYFDRQTNKEVNLNMKDTGFYIPKVKGKYDYSIHAVWTNCDATYTFLVNVN